MISAHTTYIILVASTHEVLPIGPRNNLSLFQNILLIFHVIISLNIKLASGAHLD